RVLRLAGDLVDLVDVDDPALALGQVEVRGLEQTDQDVLDVFTDVAGLGQRRRVRDRERDLEDPRERLGEERLPRTGRPDQQDVRLLELDVVEHTLMVDALVVIVDRDGEGLLRLVLADHVLIEDLLDLARRGDARDRVGGIPLLLFGQDLVAKRDALVADVDRRPGDELLDRLLGLPAERTAQVLVASHGYRRAGERHGPGPQRPGPRRYFTSPTRGP